MTHPVRVGPVEFAFTRVADPDRVLDDVVEEETRRQAAAVAARDAPPRMPYWAEVWDSAFGVGQALARDARTVGSTVLDLGCGMGLAGTTAAALGGAGAPGRPGTPRPAVRAVQHPPVAAQGGLRRLNWQADSLAETFDTILGADILYERSQWDFLEPFWRAHLSPGGAVLLGEPGARRGSCSRRG